MKGLYSGDITQHSTGFTKVIKRKAGVPGSVFITKDLDPVLHKPDTFFLLDTGEYRTGV